MLKRLATWARRQATAGGDPWRGEPPHQGWHSFDRAPWRHPWLTTANLAAMREYSAEVHRWGRETTARAGDRRFRYAFVGNLANSMYMRARPLRLVGLDIDVFLHPDDRYIMSQPGWEEFDGELPAGCDTIDAFAAQGGALPVVPGVHCLAKDPAPVGRPAYLSAADAERFSGYLPLRPTLDALQDYDACLATHVPYLAWLAGRPYVAYKTGGDLWFEASRGDVHGWLQRAAFRDAAAYAVGNPTTLADARRYGMRNWVFLPYIVDQEAYAPGPAVWRERWREATGGDFFVLSTSRLDRGVKGSHVGLDGFAAFARDHPSARLVVLGWGQDDQALTAGIKDRGLAGKVLVLPIAGKRRIVEYLRSADCVLDQFVLGYYGAGALEALACGVPVIMRLEREQYDALFPAGAPPVLDAATAEDVARHLSDMADDEERRKTLGAEGRRWFLKAHAASAWGDAYRDLLIATALGRRFDFRDSPLNAPLGDDERAYQAEELRQAPPFPNYR